jgi:hypothetical protein
MTETPKKPASLPEGALQGVAGGFTDRFGTAGSEQIVTGDDMDKIFADAGNDTVFAGGGQDEVHLGSGDDQAQLGAGDDKAFGEAGNDIIDGGAGQDEMHGGEGNDLIFGGTGDGARDLAFAGAGDDVYVWGRGDGNDEFHGEQGNDTLALTNVTFDQLQAAFTSYSWGLTMQYNPATNGVIFLDANGQQASFSGELNIGGETLKVFNIESIVVAPR